MAGPVDFSASSPTGIGDNASIAKQSGRSPRGVLSREGLKRSRITDVSHLPQMSGFGRRMPQRLGAPRVKRSSSGVPKMGGM